jgi:ribonuclease J
MSKKINFDKGLYFIPLGGCEQFGMNLNAYICDGDMIVVDCGIGFADEYHPGVDILVPDPAFIEEHQDRLKAVIVTHAHEDHIGAVARLWDAFECPVYTSDFTAAVLKKKFEEEGVKGAKIHKVSDNDEVQIGAFKVHFAPVTHSVPGAYSLFLSTPYGQCVHSGDWNLDPRPVIGEPIDKTPFVTAGDQGVLAYIGDSTNAGVSGMSGSESDVRIGMEAEFKKAKGKIAVTMFSSNISRVKIIAEAAEACGRKVAVVGRSLHRMIGCAYDCGYLDGIPDFLDEDEIGYLPDDKIVLIVTGSQGEYRAALAKIARGDFKNVSLTRGDTVIFSARSIPGNEREINTVKNNLSAAGITIVTPKDTDNVIHVSGHPCQDEIAQMLQWIRPKTLIPVHGERVQLDDHAAFARECQINNIVIPHNGSVIKIAPEEPHVAGHVDTGILAIDERRIIPDNHASIVERRKLQYTGTVHISIAVDGSGKIKGKPMIKAIGLVDENDPDDMDIMDDAGKQLIKALKKVPKQDLKHPDDVAENIRIHMRRFFKAQLGIKPLVTVHVIQV